MPSSNRPPLMTSIVDAHLGGERGVPEPGADDHVAEPDALGRHRQGGQDRERLERDLLGRPRHGVEVIEHPQRLEPELLGLLRQLDGARPGVGRVPAVVLALPALRRHQPDLHPRPRYRGAGAAMVTLCVRARRAGRSACGPRRCGQPIHRRAMSDADPPTAFDPTPPCPARPTRGTGPSRRSIAAGPPCHMTDMIAAEPAFAGALLEPPRRAGPRRRRPARRGPARCSPTGSAVDRRRLRDVRARRHSGSPRSCARRAGGRPRRGGPDRRPGVRAVARSAARGLCIGISHEGATWATNAALRRRAGRRRARRRSSPSAPARRARPRRRHRASRPVERDQSYCHTIGYTSPLARRSCGRPAAQRLGRDARRWRRGSGR